MPVLESPYQPLWFLRNGHLQTFAGALSRAPIMPTYLEGRVETDDGDFLETFELQQNSQKVAILTHGLEGSISSSYMTRLAKNLYSAGWNVLCWTMRGCGSEPNRKLYSYHSGKSEDLAQIVTQAQAQGRYRHIALIGISVGGNITLKYLGELGQRYPKEIVAAVAISVPCDLQSAALRMASAENCMYMQFFLSNLKRKLRKKQKKFPQQIDLSGFRTLRTFAHYDERYTAPHNGFSNAEAYWKACSSLPLLRSIAVPTLVLNARDDPFLGAACYPFATARDSEHLFLEAPLHGGHVGFLETGGGRYFVSRARQFISSYEPSI